MIARLTARFPNLWDGEGAEATRGSLLRGTASVAVMRVFSMTLGLATSVALARWLGVTQYGIYTYTVSWVALISVLAMGGLDRLIVRNVAVYQLQTAWGLLGGVVRWATGVSLLVSAGLVGVALVLWTLSTHLAVLPESMRHVPVSAILLAGLLVPLMVAVRLQQSVLRGLGRVAVSQTPELGVIPTLELVGIVVVAAWMSWRLSPTQVFAVYTLAAGLGLAYAVRLARRATPGDVRSAVPEYEGRKWLSSALPLLLVSAVNAMNTQIDVLMLGAFRGAHAVSLYSAADQVTNLIVFPLGVSTVALAPAFARMHADGDRARLQRLITKSTQGILLSATFIAALLVVANHPLLSLYGPAFSRSNTVLIVLSVGQLLTTAMGAVALVLIMTGHEREATIGTTVALVVNVVLNLVLIPMWGAVGAAVAVSCSIVLRSIVLAWYAQRRLGVRAAPF